MSAPSLFEFNGAQIRVIERSGEPWFVAKDVAEFLGYSKARNAIGAHCKGALKQGLPINGVTQTVTIIPERDVYRLIMRSKMPEAERFEEWVVSDVLPSIRKTGGYQIEPQAELSRMQLIQIAMDAERERLALQHEVEELTPKANALDRIATWSDGSLTITVAAKSLQIQPKKLFQWLSMNRWIYRRHGNSQWLGYQDRIQAGVVEHKVTTVERSDGSERTIEQVRVTPKGLASLAKVFEVAAF